MGLFGRRPVPTRQQEQEIAWLFGAPFDGLSPDPRADFNLPARLPLSDADYGAGLFTIFTHPGLTPGQMMREADAFAATQGRYPVQPAAKAVEHRPVEAQTSAPLPFAGATPFRNGTGDRPFVAGRPLGKRHDGPIGNDFRRAPDIPSSLTEQQKREAAWLIGTPGDKGPRTDPRDRFTPSQRGFDVNPAPHQFMAPPTKTGPVADDAKVIPITTRNDPRLRGVNSRVAAMYADPRATERQMADYLGQYGLTSAQIPGWRRAMDFRRAADFRRWANTSPAKRPPQRVNLDDIALPNDQKGDIVVTDVTPAGAKNGFVGVSLADLLSTPLLPNYDFRPDWIDFNTYSYQGRNYSRATYPGPVVSDVRTLHAGMMSTQQTASHVDRLRSGSLGAIAYGTAHSLGATPETQGLAYGLGSAADGLALGRALGPSRARSGTASGPYITSPLQPGDNLYWPPNQGFVGIGLPQRLAPGTLVDRYGSDGGFFVSPAGTPVPMRSLAPGTKSKPYNIFEVVRPLDVQGGRVAPYFGQPGQGGQFRLPMTVEQARRDGYLKHRGP